MKNNREGINMAVMSRPVQAAFVVDEAKTEQFLKKKSDPVIKERILKNAERIKKHATFSYKRQG